MKGVLALALAVLAITGCDTDEQPAAASTPFQQPGAIRPMVWSVQLDGWLFDETRFGNNRE